MDRNELIGQGALYGGSIAACTAPAAYSSESIMLLIFSACGVTATIAGLAYTVWNGNRNYKLAQEEMNLKRQEADHENHQRRSQLQPQ